MQALINSCINHDEFFLSEHRVKKSLRDARRNEKS